MDAGEFGEAVSLDSSGPGESEEGDRGAVVNACGVADSGANRQACETRIHVPRQAGDSGQHEDLVQGAEASGYRELPLA